MVHAGISRRRPSSPRSAASVTWFLNRLFTDASRDPYPQELGHERFKGLGLGLADMWLKV